PLPVQLLPDVPPLRPETIRPATPVYAEPFHEPMAAPPMMSCPSPRSSFPPGEMVSELNLLAPAADAKASVPPTVTALAVRCVALPRVMLNILPAETTRFAIPCV